jgi:hypothetical protein
LPSETSVSNSLLDTKWYSFPFVSPARGLRLVSVIYKLLSLEDGVVRETEKPKISGYLAKSRFKRVDFPAPEGPEITIGRRPGVLVLGFSLLGDFGTWHFAGCFVGLHAC